MGGVVTSNEVLCIELSSEKSTGNKTKKKTRTNIQNY